MAILKTGAHGLAVQTLQQQINRAGGKLVVDGWFGQATADAVADFQRRAGLVVDGQAGPLTLAALAGQPVHGCLKEADLIKAAAALDLPLATVKAINLVESNGCGLLENGKAKILLERHKAYAQAKAAGMDADALATAYPAIINPKRGGYQGGAAEWVRFDSLRQITSQAVAIEACSWGRFQIMGFHWQAMGYASAVDFQIAMRDEAGQLDAFVRFMLLDPALIKAAKAKKWADFASRYNGPDYKANAYDAKLSAAFDRFSEVPA